MSTSNESHHYKFRYKITNSVDSIKIIDYKTFLLLTWIITPSTKEILTDILCEEFDDLYKKLTLYRINNEQQVIDFPIYKSSGTLRLNQLPLGTYQCEVIVCNSRNESITITRSNKLYYAPHKNNKCNGYPWRQLDVPEWLSSFSGYTIYE